MCGAVCCVIGVNTTAVGNSAGLCQDMFHFANWTRISLIWDVRPRRCTSADLTHGC